MSPTDWLLLAVAATLAAAATACTHAPRGTWTAETLHPWLIGAAAVAVVVALVAVAT